MMTFAFIAIAVVTIASAAVAMTLRNLIHSALLLIGNWAGIAAFYLWAGAEFVAFAQLMVYVGAVSMVVLFAVLLTKHSLSDVHEPPHSLPRVLGAFVVGGGTFGILSGSIISTPLERLPTPAPTVTVKAIGTSLMGSNAAALLIVGVILTVALLGAIVIAASERPDAGKDES